MCLYADDKVTEEIKQGPWPRKVYKALKWYGKAFRSNVQSFVWNPGVNKSSRLSSEISAQNGDDLVAREINHGFHTYLHKDDADKSESVGRTDVVVEFTAFPEHFVAAGSNNGICQGAVFAELTLSQEEYDRALAATESLEDDDDDDYGWEDDDLDWEDDYDDWDEDEEEEEEDDWDEDEEDDYDEEEEWEEEEEDWD